MASSIPRLSFHIKKYREVIDILRAPIKVDKLPIIGEGKIFKPTSDKYGHVIIKLDLETDENTTKWFSSGYYSYEWMPNFSLEYTYGIIPLDSSFEEPVLNELMVFTTLLEMLNENTKHLRFSVIGGSFKATERPYFEAATAEALIQIMRKLNDSDSQRNIDHLQ
jgi:hypothetical protein